MTYKSEKEFQTALIKRFQKEWFYIRNIPDIWNTKKPFDISANYKWHWGAFELKYVKTQKEPTAEAVLKMLYPHQVANLLQFSGRRSRGISLVFAYHVLSNKTFCYKILDDNWGVYLKELFNSELNSKEFFDHIDLIFR